MKIRNNVYNHIVLTDALYYQLKYIIHVNYNYNLCFIDALD